MVVQEPEGHTMCSASLKMRKNLSAQGRASSQYPLLNAGWPQQVWSSGKLTSQPTRRKTVTVSTAASGKSWSTKHGTKSETLRVIGKLRILPPLPRLLKIEPVHVAHGKLEIVSEQRSLFLVELAVHHRLGGFGNRHLDPVSAVHAGQPYLPRPGLFHAQVHVANLL